MLMMVIQKNMKKLFKKIKKILKASKKMNQKETIKKENI